MRCAAVFLLALGMPALVRADPMPLMEVSVDGLQYEGAPLHWSDQMVWWLGRDGRLETFDSNRVTSYRKLSSRFRAYSSSEVRASLLREFPGYTVTGTSHYLVCHSPQTSTRYAPLFEEIYRSFTRYFNVRGFTVEQPQFPLVAILLPDRIRFEQYATREGAQVPRDVIGYYRRQSNRVVLYDATGGASITELQKRNTTTIIHEATHQVAFNTGLHDRFTENPTWVVEGLALLFEAPGVWNARANPNPNSKLNRERLEHFRRYAATRRERGTLKAFASSDDLFRKAPQDAYSEAWALTYYLVETRRQQHADYLRRIAERKQGSAYSASERLADFQNAFGKNLDLLEASFLRFINAL